MKIFSLKIVDLDSNFKVWIFFVKLWDTLQYTQLSTSWYNSKNIKSASQINCENREDWNRGKKWLLEENYFTFVYALHEDQGQLSNITF